MSRSPDSCTTPSPPRSSQIGVGLSDVIPEPIPEGPRPRAIFAWMGRDWRGFQLSSLDWRRVQLLHHSGSALISGKVLGFLASSQQLGASSFLRHTSTLSRKSYFTIYSPICREKSCGTAALGCEPPPWMIVGRSRLACEIFCLHSL
jgi:hypothetical protein